jgi:flagellar basal body-associated protein FliL
MSTAARMQPDDKNVIPPQRDRSAWIAIILTLFIAVAGAAVNYGSTRASAEANAQAIEDQRQRVIELDRVTVKTREMDRVYDVLKEINQKLDKMSDRRR